MQVGLKERLIGAAVLVVIAAIVIPWALKGNSTPGGATTSKPLALPAASNSGPVQTYRLPLNSSAAPAAGTPELPQAAPLTQGSAVNPVLQPQASAPTPAASQPASRPQAAPPAPASPAPRSSPPAKPATAGTAAGGKWVVQAGSYDRERAALAVEHKLVTRGYHAYVSRYRAKGRTYYRVRVGPFGSKEEAARAVAGVSRAAGSKAAVMPNS